MYKIVLKWGKIKKFDISSHSEIEKFINDVSEELGGLDILINNAGINRDNLSLRMKDEEWQKVIDVNLTSTFLLSKYAIKKMMKSNSGRVINITSIVGHTGNIGQSNYAASKSGTIGMSKSLSIEYAKKNINTLLTIELIFIIVTSFVVFTSQPMNWMVGLIMIFHIFGVVWIVAFPESFYSMYEESMSIDPGSVESMSGWILIGFGIFVYLSRIIT